MRRAVRGQTVVFGRRLSRGLESHQAYLLVAHPLPVGPGVLVPEGLSAGAQDLKLLDKVLQRKCEY